MITKLGTLLYQSVRKMHLLDLILVSVLLPCTTGQTCDDFKVKHDFKVEHPNMLFYGRNVTLTFATSIIIENTTPILKEHSQRPLFYDPINKNHTFIFTLFNVTSELRDWSVIVKYGDCWTDYIHLKLNDLPKLENKEDIEQKCNGCVLSTTEQPSNQVSGVSPWISCSAPSDNEYIEVTVTFTINDLDCASNKSANGQYIANYVVQDKDHLAKVVCTATYRNNTQQIKLQDNATLYVVKPPTNVQLQDTVLKPGSRPRCVSSGGRPKPKLHLFLDGESSSGESEVAYNETTRTYTKSLFLSNKSDMASMHQKRLRCIQYRPKDDHIWKETAMTLLNDSTTIVTNLNTKTQSTQMFTDTTKASTKRATEIKGVPTTQRPISTTQSVVPTSSPSDALKTTENLIPTTNTGQGKNDASVLNPRAANDGSQNVIIAVACVVSVLIVVIAVVIAVVCVKRKRRSMANGPLQDTPREDQVAQEEGYASIGGSECQYAVVNKPKKQSTLQAKQDPPVENKPMEMKSKLEKPSGAGELIYADLDKEALTAKPINSTPAGTVEYVGIDFARTGALQDANKQDE